MLLKSVKQLEYSFFWVNFFSFSRKQRKYLLREKIENFNRRSGGTVDLDVSQSHRYRYICVAQSLPGYLSLISPIG